MIVRENRNTEKFYENIRFMDIGIILKDKIENFYFSELVIHDFDK
ncbi:hypothetical protein [Leptotrichia sp. OH3620_COT-345]|nr:hypothetical protein [Leptotrichia sp. OH3620_COT-345]